MDNVRQVNDFENMTLAAQLKEVKRSAFAREGLNLDAGLAAENLNHAPPGLSAIAHKDQAASRNSIRNGNRCLESWEYRFAMPLAMRCRTNSGAGRSKRSIV